MVPAGCCFVALLLVAGVSAGPHQVSATQSSIALVQEFDFEAGGVAHVNVSTFDRITMAVAVCRSIENMQAWNVLRCFQDTALCTAVRLKPSDGGWQYARLDTPITEADHYYVVVSPCEIRGSVFPQFSFYAWLELMNPGGEYLSAGEIPLKITTTIETLLWLALYVGFMAYHMQLRRKTGTFNRLVYFLSAWPASQCCMTAVGSLKVWYMHFTGQPSTAVTIFVGVGTALALVASAAVMFLLAAGFATVSAEPWKTHQWWLMSVMVAIIAAALSAGMLLSRSAMSMAEFGALALVLSLSFVYVLVVLFVLIRKTRRTIDTCAAHAERRADISSRYQKFAIASAFTLAGAVIFLVALAGLAFWSNTVIPTWISDTYFSFLFMMYCASTLFFFRLTVNEDLNLAPLLPATPEFHSPMGELPDAPEGFIDDDGEEAF